MSRRKPPDPLGSNTRQMLDELDVLMEKMLALPVNQLEGSAAPSPAARNLPEPRAQTSTRTASRAESGSPQILVGQLSILHSPTTHDAFPSPKSPTRDDRVAAIAAAPRREEAEVGTYGGGDTGDTASEYLPPLSSLPPATGEVRLPAARRFSLRIRPLLWLNQGFD